MRREYGRREGRLEEGRLPEYGTNAYDRGDLFFDICCLMYINVHIRQIHIVIL